jgi:RNA polymerase sigma-70 factor (ECF subfamily)
MQPERLTSLYREFGPSIYARCRSLLGDERAAEDATQETFIRVLRHLDRLPLAHEALFWIYRVATNYCLNEIRDRRTRAVAGGDPPDLPEKEGAAEGRLEDRDLVRRLVERCRPKVRVIAWLYHVDGFEQQEVADIVGVSRRTVASRLSEFSRNARKFMRRSAT